MKHKPLNIQNLSKKYGQFTAVNSISFSIEPGEIFGLLGPNGAGKTSTISCITSLETPSSGTIEVFGYDNQKQEQHAKHLLGCVPQELISHGYFSVEEILRMHAGYYGLKKQKGQLDYLLHKMDLFEHRKKLVTQLSGGMKRRLLIAKALVHNPKLLLLDEPTAGVDVELRHSLWELILSLKEEGSSILLTTHYLEEAEHLCDRVAIINHGSIIRTSPTQELINEEGMRHVILILSNPLPPIQSAHVSNQTDKQLTLTIPQESHLFPILKQLGISTDSIEDIRIREANLEEVFTKLLGEEVE